MTTRLARATVVASRGTSSPAGARRRAGRTRLACLAIGVLVAVVSVSVTSIGVAAQQADEVVRIVARKLENGKVEFALQQHRSDGSWGDHRLPSKRLFPTTATVGRWLQSTPMSVSIVAPGSTSASDEVVRIVARKLENGKIEFALQQRRADSSWGDRRLPSKRLFPTTATVGRWLQSTPLSVTTTAPRRGETTAPVEDQAVNQPEEDQVMPPNSDFVAQDRFLMARVMNCFFNDQTGECKYIIDGWDAERIILGHEKLYGDDCDPDPGSGYCRVWDSWSLEMYDQRMSELVCLKGWYFSRHDWLCHSTPQTS